MNGNVKHGCHYQSYTRQKVRYRRMTIDEAIRHCVEVAEEQEELYRICPASESELFHCNGTKDCRVLKNGKNKGCQKCAAQHRQFARWLKELKQLRKQSKTGRWIPCNKRLPEERYWCLAVFEEVDTGFIGLPYIAEYLMGNHTIATTEDGWIIHNCTDIEGSASEYYKKLRCVAWQPLPEPYKA